MKKNGIFFHKMYHYFWKFYHSIWKKSQKKIHTKKNFYTKFFVKKLKFIPKKNLPNIWKIYQKFEKNTFLLWKLYQILNFTWNEGVMTWQCQKMSRMAHNDMTPMVDVQDEQNRAKFQSYSDILDLCQSKTPPPPHSTLLVLAYSPLKSPRELSS